MLETTKLIHHLKRNLPDEKIIVWNMKRNQEKLADTITLFQQAKCIIGPHGAQFLNILWAPKGTPIIEIGYFDNAYTLPSTYYSLSIALGHVYYLVIGQGKF
jgi:hypothetical protein